jgi:hypothetical protein
MPKAKAKRNWKHIHKIRIHDNRWLAWTIALAVLMCASLVAYIQVTGIQFETSMHFSSDANTGWATFTNRSGGYTVKYPKNWGLEADGDRSMSFVDTTQADSYFSVAVHSASDERAIRSSLFPTSEKQIKVAGMDAVKITQNRNLGETVALLRDGETLYVMRGMGDNFDRMLATFRLNQKIE